MMSSDDSSVRLGLERIRDSGAASNACSCILPDDQVSELVLSGSEATSEAQALFDEHKGCPKDESCFEGQNLNIVWNK